MREGYKMTELGEIPVDWEVFKLGDLFDFKNGINAGKERYGDGVKFVNVMEIIYNESITEEIVKGSVQVTSEQLDLYSVYYGDILFNRTSETAHEVGLTAVYLSEKKVVFGGFVIRARQLHGQIDAHFKKYFLRSKSVRDQIIKSGQGVVRTNIGQGELGKICFSLPPLLEQQKIATILSTVDEKIEVIDAQITQTKALKKGLMQKLLTRGIGHTKFKDSVLGEIPESWEVVKIDKHIELITGFPFKSEEFSELSLGTRLLRGVNITVGNLRWNEKIDRYWDQEFADFKKYSVKAGDLVISMDGSLVGRNYARVGEGDLPLLLVQRVACLRAKVSMELELLRQIVSSNFFINYVDTVKTSSGIPHISSKDIKDFKIAFPPLIEQRKIAEILSAIDNKINLLELKKQSYQDLKKGLMQQLLTGKVRVLN